MKIVEIARSFYPSWGGLEKFISDRVKIYNDLMLDYEIITTDYSTEKSNYDIPISNVIRYQQYSKYNFVYGLKKHLPTSCDLVMVNQVGNYLSDRAIFHYSKLGVPVYLTPHMYFHTSSYSWLKKMHKKILLNRLLDRIDKMICFTEFEKQYWIKLAEIDSNKIIVIPHYFNRNEVESVDNNLGLYLLYVGRFSPNKRIELLIRSFLELENYPYSLYLTINSSDLNNRLRIEIKKNERIKLLGNISEEEKKQYLRNCSGLILPTDYEAFSIVTLEASDYKKPLLLSQLPIFHETLNKEGIIYFTNDILSIKKALISYGELSKETLQIMGEKNYINLERYSYQKIKKKYQEILTVSR